jgi:hypothetical protein
MSETDRGRAEFELAARGILVSLCELICGRRIILLAPVGSRQKTPSDKHCGEDIAV